MTLEEPMTASAAIDAATKAVLTMTASTQPDGSPAPWSSHQSHNYNASCIVCRGDVRAIIEAAAPILERQLRHEIADELFEWSNEKGRTEVFGPLAARRRAIQSAARHIAPMPTPEEIVDALRRGDFVGCHLDDAGRSIAPDSQPGKESH